ncbi:MAG: SCO family protein, partial [Limisphaerales bacterium]
LWLFLAILVFLFSTMAAFASQNSLTDVQLLQIKFDQKPGSQVSPNLVFRDESGKQVRLGDFFGKRPLILILGYYRCPMLCGLILDGMTESLRDLRWTAGKQFDVIFVSIDPRERPSFAASRKKIYLRDYGRFGTADGWHFLVASKGAPRDADPPPANAAILTLAREIGFRFAYDPGLKQFAHPAGFVVLTPRGKVAHYFFGVIFSAKEMDTALRDASAKKIDSPVADFILLCCEYSPLRGKYGHAIMDTIRVGGVGMVAVFGFYFFRPVRRKSGLPK